jgi:hypothetical protein
MTADDLQVCALKFAPPHAHAIVLTVFRSSLLQNLLKGGLHGPCGPSGAADRMYQRAGVTESINSPAPARAMRRLLWL